MKYSETIKNIDVENNVMERCLTILPKIIGIYISMYGFAAKSLQSCPTVCDPVDGSPLGSSVPGILQARILEWVAIAFSMYGFIWVYIEIIMYYIVIYINKTICNY